MALTKPNSTIPNIGNDFRQAAKPFIETVEKNASLSIDRLQEQFSTFFKDHPALNQALDTLQTDLAAGHGLEGLQTFFKTLLEDTSKPAGPLVKTDMASVAPVASASPITAPSPNA